MAEKWIAKALEKSKKGALRKSLGVKKGQTIPMGQLESAMHSKSAKTRKRASLAKTLTSFSKAK